MIKLGDIRLSNRESIGVAILVVVTVAIGYVLPNNGYFIRIATLVLMYAGMGGAWNLISGYGNQISLGHSAFFGFGAYSSTLLFIHFGLSPWIGMLIAAIGGVVLSLVIGLPTFRLRGHYYALATIAVAELLAILALYFRGLTGGAVGLTVPFVPNATWWDFQFFGGRAYYFIALAMLAVTVAITYWVERGPLGYRLRALRHSHNAAEVVGVNTMRTKLQANAISGFLMAAFGCFYAQFHYFFDPTSVFGFWTVSVYVAMVVILGGAATIWGPFLGAFILVCLDAWTNTVFTGDLAALSRLMYACILIVLIVYRPAGLMSLFNGLFTRGSSARQTTEEG